MGGQSGRAGAGTWVVLLGALIGLAEAIFAYFWTGNGIHGTAGVLLMIASTALMLLAAGALVLWPAMPRWLRGILLFLILLDIFGSGFAAYMLEAWWLVGAMALALVGWIVRLAFEPTPGFAPVQA